MIYTFSKRKELNSMTEKRYPDITFHWKRDGLPRMRSYERPKNTEEITSTKLLEVYAYRFWQEQKQPLPVFIAVQNQAGDVYYEVNYVSHLSTQGLMHAYQYLSQGRLFAEPILNSQTT